MRDFLLWWALFVAFAVVSVVVAQRSYRRWRSARAALAGMDAPRPAALERSLRREGWRLVWMALSLVAMTGLVFAAVSGAPPLMIAALRTAAVLAVAAVVGLSLFR